MLRYVTVVFVSVSVLQPVCCNYKKDEIQRRSLQVGDIFTPNDLIKVAKKLRSKVENPGDGKGIVSSSKNAEMLADRIYSAFFSQSTRSRFTPILEADIPGLDALQALALSGDDFKPHIHFEKDFDHSATRRSKSDARRCRYAFITRRSDEGHSPERRRGAKPEAKYLAKKLRIQIQAARKSGNETTTESTIVVNSNHMTTPMQSEKDAPPDISVTPKDIEKKPLLPKYDKNCIWKYMCKNPVNMDTCQLYPECPEEGSNSTFDDIPIEHNEDEHDESIQSVRKMLGIYIIDEEVEKIFERRILLLPSAKLNENQKKEVESLKYYFDNIINGQLSRTTKVYDPRMEEEHTTHKPRKSIFWNLKKGHHKAFRPQGKEEDVPVNTNFPLWFPTTTPFRPR